MRYYGGAAEGLWVKMVGVFGDRCVFGGNGGKKRRALGARGGGLCGGGLVGGVGQRG
ncbi:MAG: hypothetical protein AAF320_06695 [Myxococcota bacterium]